MRPHRGQYLASPKYIISPACPSMNTRVSLTYRANVDAAVTPDVSHRAYFLGIAYL